MEQSKDMQLGRKEEELIAAAGKRQAVKRPGRNAKKEAQNFSEQDKNWPFKIRKSIFQAMRIGVWALAVFGLLALGAVLFHYVAPLGWRWLSPTELHSLSDVVGFLTSGAVGVFLSKYMAHIFQDLDEKSDWS